MGARKQIIFLSILAYLIAGFFCKPAKNDEDHPYEFGFTIDGQQHRHEKKDERGIIQGEFGFITADGIYHVTVYATDENGNFKILSMKNVRISAPLDGSPGPGPAPDAKNVQNKEKPQPLPLGVPETTKAPIQAISTTVKTQFEFTTQPTIKPACASCGYVTTPKPGQTLQQNSQQGYNQQQNGQQAYNRQGNGQQTYNQQENGQQNGQQGFNQQQNNQQAYNQQQNGQQTYNKQGNGQQTYNQQENGQQNDHQGYNQQQNNQQAYNQQENGQQTYKQENGQQNGQQTYNQQQNDQQAYNKQQNDQQAYNQQQNDQQTYNQQPNALTIPEKTTNNQNYNQENPLNPQPNALAIPENQPPSTLPPISVDNNQIQVGGDNPQTIPIKDKFPGMTQGLPDGVSEKDIKDLLYKFSYEVGFHGHWEKGLKNGAKIGGYFVNGRDGVSRVVTYIADENGYRPKFKFVRLGLESDETPKEGSEKTFGLKSFEFVWYPIE